MADPVHFDRVHCDPPVSRRAGIDRRRALMLAAGGLATWPLIGCQEKSPWHASDVTGALPSLAFTMTRASDGKTVTAQDYAGKVVMLYFGYTFCPDVCPTTLINVTDVLKRLGPAADKVQVLFVTVDPNRDTLPVLKDYVGNFAPQVEGLRGTPNELAALGKRFRVGYSVTPDHDGKPYTVTHGSAIYVFDQTGAARLLVAQMSTPKPDIDGTVADLRRLIEKGGASGFFTRLMQMV